MNSLLVAINAKYIHSNLAVYSLKAAAGAYAEMVELAEYTINHHTDDIFRSIWRRQPQLLFFSCYIWNRSVICELAANLKKVMPELVIWVGGPEVSYDAEAFLMENPQFFGVMCQEGERTFAKVLEYYLTREAAAGVPVMTDQRIVRETKEQGEGSSPGMALKDIAGIVYRNGDGIVTTAAAPHMGTLDELPFVYGQPFVQEQEEIFANRIIYYESSRGCPFSCSYCLSSLDRTVRFRSLSLVKQELLYFLERRVPQVKFVDRTFNCRHSHAIEIWKFIKEHDNGVTNFHFEIAADLLTDEEIALLATLRPGLVQLEIGVQTTNPRTLRAICRSDSFEKIQNAVQRIAAGGNIHQHLDLIAGLPYEDLDSFKKSFDEVYRLKPQELQLGFLKVLRGSRMHRCAKEYGILYRSEPPYEVLATRWISCGELLHLKDIEEMLEVYYNSRQFCCTIEALEQLFERPFALYEALARYYRAHGEDGRSYSRLQRFEMLRGFIAEMTAGDGHTDEERRRFDELLTVDLYLRENAKTRPDWAQDQKEYREAIAAFYQSGEGARQYLMQYEDRTWKQLMRMTHLERVSLQTAAAVGVEVSGIEASQEVCESGVWLLFDYQKRSPLTGNASVQCICRPGKQAGEGTGGRDGRQLRSV